MPFTAPQANTSVCPRCGAGLRCGNVAGDAQCWCSQLPNIMPVPAERAPLAPTGPDAASASAASCFCPACLQKITDERLNLHAAS
ncbi:MAG: cysteine-rich CWC family protein [Polaromonas sp.]|nr:cysteine-rich CWC family protein [Polaromonas sp.]